MLMGLKTLLEAIFIFLNIVLNVLYHWPLLTYLNQQSVQVEGKTGQRWSFRSCTYMQFGGSLAIHVLGKLKLMRLLLLKFVLYLQYCIGGPVKQ